MRYYVTRMNLECLDEFTPVSYLYFVVAFSVTVLVFLVVQKQFRKGIEHDSFEVIPSLYARNESRGS